jgi:hypothetical protein
MNISKISRTLMLLLWIISISCASGSSESQSTQKEQKEIDPVDKVLKKLNKTTQELKSLECRIEYKDVQPSVFDTETLRKGILYYSKKGNESKLRVNFQTVQQNDEPEQKCIEQYIVVDGALLKSDAHDFEGMWLVKLDYEFKTIMYIQITEANDSNEPVDVFELISRNLPTVGFTKIEDLKKQFEISLIDEKKNEQEEFIQVHLKIKPNSVYKDDYTQIDFWIDKKINLPAKIKAVSTEPNGSIENKDFCEIELLELKLNQKIDPDIFNFSIPKDFEEPEISPLQKAQDNT